MYHAIVRRRVRALFDAVNRGNAAPVIAMIAGRFEHAFLGDHALGGSRRGLDATRAWYGRLWRLLPDLRFDLHRVQVAGPPWNTIVTAEWSETNSGTDGVRTGNSGIHVLHLRWGRATRLLIATDTVALTATLQRIARAGTAEALAPPILD
ncbi:MAG: nuclear transport factor 2 family protein [Sneathiellaceae bacterium]